MTNNNPGSELISLEMAPRDHNHSSEKVPSPVTMNNRGARLILEGRHQEALRCLATSMKHTRALLSRDRQPRQGSNGTVMTCKPVNPASIGVTGRGDAPDANRPTTTSFSTDHHSSSLDEQSASRRGRGPSSLHSARRVTFRHGSSGTMNSSISRQEEAGTSAATTSTPMENLLVGRGLSSSRKDPCSTTTKVDEDQPADFAKRTTSAAGCAQKKTVQMSLGSSNTTFVYADPIVLDEEPFVCHRHQKCLMKITVTILFNMALAHHLMARSTLTRLQEDEGHQSLDEETRNELQRHCKSDLKRAVALYTLSCRIHVFERLSMNEMVAMAHLNNLGQIHAILGNTSLSNAFFEKLLSNLALFSESNRDGKHPATRRGRRGRRLAGFYRNAAQIILRGPELAPAA